MPSSLSICDYCNISFDYRDMDWEGDKLGCPLCLVFEEFRSSPNEFVNKHGQGFTGFICKGKTPDDFYREKVS